MRKLLLIIFFSSTVLAQDNLLSLNLEEAIEYGIENNRNLKNAEREIQMAFKERVFWYPNNMVFWHPFWTGMLELANGSFDRDAGAS